MLAADEAIVVVEDPELDGAVVRGSRQEAVLEGIPLQVLNQSLVAFKEGNVCLKGGRLVRTEDADGTGGSPGHSDHLSVRCDTLMLSSSRALDAHKVDSHVEVHVLERPFRVVGRSADDRRRF